jgi:hypothetical protein
MGWKKGEFAYFYIISQIDVFFFSLIGLRFGISTSSICYIVRKLTSRYKGHKHVC